MVEKIRTWGDLGFVNNGRKDEPIPNFNWGSLSKFDIATAQREDLTGEEALRVLDNWLDANGNGFNTSKEPSMEPHGYWLSPNHPIGNIALALRPKDLDRRVSDLFDSIWITLARTKENYLPVAIYNVEEKGNGEECSSFVGGFDARETLNKQLKPYKFSGRYI